MLDTIKDTKEVKYIVLVLEKLTRDTTDSVEAAIEYTLVYNHVLNCMLYVFKGVSHAVGIARQVSSKTGGGKMEAS